MNTGNMCFANSVLQLLLHVPPFWNLFRELGRLKGSRGARGPETAGGATPLVDATVRLVEEFMPKEKELPSTRQPPELEHAEIGRPRADEEEKKENKLVDSFEPTYMYNAMKENGRLKTMLVRPRDQDASFCY
jgi:ubiquitin carboxyl-terminal hydrolase 10